MQGREAAKNRTPQDHSLYIGDGEDGTETKKIILFSLQAVLPMMEQLKLTKSS